MEIFITVLKYILPLVIALIADRIINKGFDKASMLNGKIHLVLLKSLLIAAVWAIAVTASLSNIPGFTKTWEALIAGSGILAVVVGLAAQDTFSNVFAGFAISASSTRPFDVGDRVMIGDIGPGYIMDISLRHVVLETFDHQKIFVPNSMVGKSVIINYTQMPGYAAPIEISVAYGTPLKRAMEIMEDVILSHPDHYGENNAAVRIEGTQDSGILLKGLMFTPRFEDSKMACSDCYLEIIRRFGEESIEIPYNKLEILEKGAGREDLPAE